MRKFQPELQNLTRTPFAHYKTNSCIRTFCKLIFERRLLRKFSFEFLIPFRVTCIFTLKIQITFFKSTQPLARFFLAGFQLLDLFSQALLLSRRCLIFALETLELESKILLLVQLAATNGIAIYICRELYRTDPCAFARSY